MWESVRKDMLIVVVLLTALLGVTAEVHARPADRDALPAMVRRVLPAVVSITTRQIEYDEFNHPTPVRGLGSGFIIDRRGYILTNNHVVDGAEQIRVTLTDERVFRATLVGTDAFTDLALVKIDGAAFPTVRLGASARLEVGETVVAIGSPLWIEGGPTVTVGVVSALGRSMEQPDLPVLHGLIQTDAAINHGNSGGPLLNRTGEVIGINTALIASAHGIGFAIAIDMAKPVVEALLKSGRVVRASMGLSAVSVTPQVAYANDLAIDRGALVTHVDAGGPAETAGVQVGDVVLEIEGKRVKGLHDLHERMERHRGGEAVEVAIQRKDQALRLRVVLGDER